ncbi:MAG: peptide ABC transporter ATP-binding protein [Acidimicrobiaceae bacterium]|nr:peptide ABC transporter ATP-binding protein [Acidimicrobiaceae bacterium]
MLEATSLDKSFVVERDALGRVRRSLHAVDDVSLRVEPGRTLALVGESGCGKSTTAELILQLQAPDAGSVVLDGQELTGMPSKLLRATRRRIQPVFQDPYSSLDPSQTIGSGLNELLAIHGIGSSRERVERAQRVLERVGLPSDPRALSRYPGEFSGGQRQRVAIARALIVEPDYVVLDEAVSALDVSTQALVLQLLIDLQRERELGYLFISHDLGVVRHLAHDVAVMYLGQIVEHGPAEQIYKRPSHPYTRALLDAVPDPDPDFQHARRTRRIVVSGDPPDPTQRPAGCSFRLRCPFAHEVCAQEDPSLSEFDGRLVACHFASDVLSSDFSADGEVVEAGPA